MSEKIFSFAEDFRGHVRGRDWLAVTAYLFCSHSTTVAAKLLYRQQGSRHLLKLGAKLDDAYFQFLLSIARQQLARAGVRVAWILNQTFR